MGAMVFSCDRIHFHRVLFFSGLFLVLILLSLVGPARSAQVTVAWEPNTEPDLAGYRIYYGLTSDQYGNPIDVGKQTSYTVASLEDGKTYYFAATAYDQYGDESDFSDEVVFTAPVPCIYTVSPAGQSFASEGGVGAVDVTTQTGCAWTSVSNASWLVITSNSNVAGNGTVNYSALSNPSSFTRTSTLTVADQSITLTQGGISTVAITGSAGSNGSISPQGSVSVNSGGSQTFTITPAANYRVADVKVDGVSKEPITTYTFSNVTSSHSISATFARKLSRR
jgi:hypothetical protein